MAYKSFIYPWGVVNHDKDLLSVIAGMINFSVEMSLFEMGFLSVGQ